MICADTNAWSTLWGSEVTNARGEFLEDLVMRFDLVINNTGHVPTFSGRGDTCIDVTFSKKYRYFKLDGK